LFNVLLVYFSVHNLTIQVHERTAQQELIAEAQTTGLETRGKRQEAQSGSERINEGQGGQNETSHNGLLLVK
jgi:hypothetical protein